MRERSTYYEVERPITGIEPIRYGAEIHSYRVEIGDNAELILAVKATEIEEMGFNTIGTIVKVRIETTN